LQKIWLIVSSFVCLVIGILVGVLFATQIKSSEPALAAQAFVNKLPFAKTIKREDPESPWESYEYPTIKWRAHPLADAPGAIVQLSTTYDAGNLKYRLTLFKGRADQREVQLLDGQGFKLMQFEASDFHDVPGAPDIVEARESVACPEKQYKMIRDYSVK
jgi:hypothetical protein